MQMQAKLKDGTPVIVVHENKGDVVPAFTKTGTPYAAFTSLIEIRALDGKRLDLGYGQIAKAFDKPGVDFNALREAEDTAIMESMGVDLTTLTALHA